MRRPNSKYEGCEVYLSQKQIALLHQIVTEFEENGGTHHLTDEETAVFDKIAMKLERSNDFCVRRRDR